MLCATIFTVLSTSFAGATGVVPPRDPTSNVPASPNFNTTANHYYTVGTKLPPCWRWRAGEIAANASSVECVTAEVQATIHAHRLEHIGGVTLPRNFSLLSANEQSLVLVDLERVSRGERPVLGLSLAADTMAQHAAQLNEDPTLSSQHAIPGATGGWTANWAAAVSPLDANYSWMYLDGWGGKGNTFNFTCTSASARGCWGHRNDILVNSSQLPCYATNCSLVMGAGNVADNWAKTYNSYTELIVQVAGTTPGLIYTWKQALAQGARA
jgi:hypothetical protein